MEVTLNAIHEDNIAKANAEPVILPIVGQPKPEPEPTILAFPKIGIAPVALRDEACRISEQDAEKLFDAAEAEQPRATAVSGLILPESAKPAATLGLVDASGERVSSLTWPKYLAWRKTKCRPYDYETMPGYATHLASSLDQVVQVSVRDRALEEIDQATHEFVGEVAELGELILEHGPMIFFGERSKLIDEIGDIFFCGAWVLDAWGLNPLNDIDDDVEIATPNQTAQRAASLIAANTLEQLAGHPTFLNQIGAQVVDLSFNASVQAGLLSNSFKKLRFQRREQNVKQQAERVIAVFVFVLQILHLASATTVDALRSNMAKLDARFPEGYKPGIGGGIRTGRGA